MRVHPRSSRPVALAFGLGLVLVLPPVAGAQDADEAEAAPAGLVRTELSLSVRPLTFSFDSTLRATESRPLLASGQSAPEARIRLGEMAVSPILKIGTLDPVARAEAGEPRVAGPTDVWFTRVEGGWALELERKPDAAAEGGDESGDDGGIVGRIPLSREAAELRETLSVALVPTSDDSGQLVLRWHDHRWTADFEMLSLPAAARARPDDDEEEEEGEEEEEEEEDDGPRVPTETESLAFDSDTSAGARLLRLVERNETAIVLPDESRLSVLVWQEQLVEHDDFAALATLGDGEVVRLTLGAVIRLRNEVPLQFGDVPIPTENLAPEFPGSYGLWLKRAGDGWRLVFNHEADSWGTQHDPAFDAAEIDLEHSEDGLATRSLGAALVPVTAQSGRLVIHWGPHDWAADFTIQE